MADEAMPKAVRLLWSDCSGLRRCRVVPGYRYREVASSGVGITKACMAQTAHSDSPADGSGLSAQGEVRLVPVDSTRVAVPWRPQHHWAVCEFVDSEYGEPWSCCPRTGLRNALAALKREFGLELKAGFEFEFQLLEHYLAGPGSSGVSSAVATNTSPHGGGLSGTTLWPVNVARYCQASAFDRHAAVLDDIVDALAQMSIRVVQFHAESASGQFEIATSYDDALLAADRVLFTRETICAVARRHGLFATFLPKVMRHEAGNACHCHLSLWKDGRNVMDASSSSPAATQEQQQQQQEEQSPPGPVPSREGAAFTAGLLASLEALLPFTAPSNNSYERFRAGAWAGAYAAWGWNNREVPLRMTAPSWRRLDETNLEYKAFDGTANPHIALTAIVAAGMTGLAAGLELPEPCLVNPEALAADEAERMGVRQLPTSLPAALEQLRGPRGEALQTRLAQVLGGGELLRAYLAVRDAEAEHKDYMSDLLLRYS